MPYLIDSDVMVGLLENDVATGELVERLTKDSIAISSVTYMEVYHGIYQSPDIRTAEAAFLRFLSDVPVLPLSLDVAQRCARLREDLRQQGRSLRSRSLDLIIAATALESELTLVTRNTKHYDDVPGFELYRFE